MAGMCRHTGRALDGLDHLTQSVGDIITTRLDTRALRRWYGGEFMDLIDAPVNAGTMVDWTFAIADCLGRHEDRISITGVRFTQPAEGQLQVILEGNLTTTGKAVVLGAIPVGGRR